MKSERNRSWRAAFVLLAAGAVGVATATVTAEETFEYRNGDVLLTRNRPADGNVTPGYWNHCAIVVVGTGGAYVVEAQETQGIIAVEIEKFRKRYPEYMLLRPNLNDDVCLRAATAAYEQAGSPTRYGALASLKPEVGTADRRDNCVTIVRRCYWIATGVDPGWKTPDCVYKFRERAGFRIMIHHRDYETFVPPENIWDGTLEK